MTDSGFICEMSPYIYSHLDSPVLIINAEHRHQISSQTGISCRLIWVTCFKNLYLHIKFSHLSPAPKLCNILFPCEREQCRPTNYLYFISSEKVCSWEGVGGNMPLRAYRQQHQSTENNFYFSYQQLFLSKRKVNIECVLGGCVIKHLCAVLRYLN